jgi:glycine betaine/proline transport system substrate-binding protein
MPTRRRFGVAAARGLAGIAAMSPTLSSYAASHRLAGKPVVLGQIGLTFYQVIGGAIQVVFDRLGVRYTITEGSHGEIYPQLAAGHIDLLVAAWLPHAHGPLHQASVATTFELATLYQDARLFWAVPAFVPSHEVSSVNDLLRPSVIDRMDKRIVGIGPDSGLMRGAAQIHRDYGLGSVGYVVRTDGAAAWIAAARSAVNERRWAVIPLWQPQWMNKEFSFRALDEPRGIYQTDRCVLVAANSLRQALPTDVQAVLSRMSFSIADVTQMDHAMVIGGLSAKEAAQRWMTENPGAVRHWFG